MDPWHVILAKAAQKDSKKLKSAGLDRKALELIAILSVSPFQTPPPYEKLGGLDRVYSRRINKQHRLSYQVDQPSRTVIVTRLWGHYE